MSRPRPEAVSLALLLLATLVLPGSSAGTATTHPYLAGTNVYGAEAGTPPVTVCAEGCLGGLAPREACCVGGFLFAFPSDLVSVSADDLVWGSHVGLMVCVQNMQGDHCGGDQQVGPRCGPMTIIVFGAIPTRALAFVHTVLVEEDLVVCGASQGTVTIQDER